MFMIFEDIFERKRFPKIIRNKKIGLFDAQHYMSTVPKT